MMNNNKRSVYMMLVLMISLLSGCIKVEAPASGEFPYQLMLQKDELPQGWFRVTNGARQESGAVASQNWGYEYQSKELSKILSHQLTIYRDEVSARNAFGDWVARYIPTGDWQTPDGITFVPKNSRDQIALKCLSDIINGESSLACRFIQQHGNYISKILVNIDERTITMKQFEEILINLDERMNQEDKKESSDNAPQPTQRSTGGRPVTPTHPDAIERTTIEPTPVIQLNDGGLLSGKPCQAPCFLGIQPDISNEKQVLQALDSLGYPPLCQPFKNEIDENYPGISCGDQLTVVLKKDKDSVAGLAFTPTTAVTVEDVIKKYGNPDGLWIDLKGLPAETVRVILFYRQYGMRLFLPEQPVNNQNDITYAVEPGTRVIQVSYENTESFGRLINPLHFNSPEFIWYGYRKYRDR